MSSPKLTLLTFFTEGPPHDQGLDLAEAERVFRTHTAPHVDAYVSYSPRRLVHEDPGCAHAVADYRPWLNDHPRRSELGSFKAGWAAIAFSIWKPYIIQRVLASPNFGEGDLLLYHDVNCIAYPNYVKKCEEWKRLSIRLLDDLKTDIFLVQGLPLRYDVKACLVRKYLDETYLDRRGVRGGLVLLRRSPATLAFVDEWIKMASELEDVSPLPNTNPVRAFVWHSCEQSVLSVLVHRWCREQRLQESCFRFQLEGFLYSRASLIDTRSLPGRLRLRVNWVRYHLRRQRDRWFGR